MTFEEPVYVGNLVMVVAELTYVGRTSMEIRVYVTAEDPLSGSTTHTNLAYLVYVAIDDGGSPHPVPRLVAETPEEQMRMQQAEERQALRKERHRREQALRESESSPDLRS
jgi:acyl-CoA hydrolase